ncbi:MAG: FG-GAP-like repeat-containing protein [Deltaproteobacteria bacterium]
MSSDSSNCGACGHRCVGLFQACVDGACAFACGVNGAPPDACPSVQPSFCTNLQWDSQNCGACSAACQTGQACDNGACTRLKCAQGTFTVSPPIVVGANPVAVGVADLNGDGSPDLAIALSGGVGGAALLFRAADGGFSPATSLGLPAAPSSIQAIDLNRDGIPDLLVALPSSNALAIEYGVGDGGFVVGPTLPLPASPVDAVAADLEQSGYPLIVAPLAQRASFYLSGQQEDGGFGQGFSVDIPFNPSSAVLLGAFDVALIGTEANECAMVMNYPWQGALDVPPLGPLPTSLVRYQNGWAASNRLSGTVSTVFWNGQAYVGSPSSPTNQAASVVVGTAPVALVSGDWNLDGVPDLAVANSGSGSVSVLIGNGDGTFQPQVAYSVGANPVALVSADLQGTGALDLVVVNEADGTVQILENNCP